MLSTTSSPLSSPGSVLSPVPSNERDVEASVTLPAAEILPPPVAATTERMRDLDISPSPAATDKDQVMVDAAPAFTGSIKALSVSPTPSLKDILKKTLMKKENVQRD